MNLNATSPSGCGTIPGYTLGCGLGHTPPFTQFGNIQNINDIGSARYDSLQIKAETKSMRHGLYALLGYTWARAFDSGYSDGLGTSTGATYYPLPGSARGDWALSQINLNSSFTASVIYALPFGRGKEYGSNWNGFMDAVLGGWQVNVIQKITSGFPVFIVDSANNSGVNFTNNSTNFIRPNQVCSGGGNNSIQQFFNTACFTQPADGELGNANRAPVNGPDFVNTDFSAAKHFKFGERMDLEFRAEFFNLFNHAQFYLPGNDLAAPSTFGVITETVNNPRLLQFGLKMTF
jgi:hypothetical protein